MSNTEFMPLFVTKVRKVGNSEPTPPTNPLPRSVVGSCVPETDVGIGVNEEVPTNLEVPTNVEQEQEATGFHQFEEFDTPFYNNDPIVDLNMDDEHDLAVDEPVAGPLLRLECVPSN